MTELPQALSRASIPEPVLAVIRRLKERGFQAFLVGGCVRDLVRGETPKDFDVATSALPEQVQRSFSKVIPTGIKHGTVTVLSGKESIEVTTFRSEGAYLDGRRPSTVEFKTEIADDLSRRDFTINAMAFDPVDQKLVDPFGGQKDLAARVIRCVGDAQARFDEDGLRAMRAVRFAAVLGYEIDPATKAAIAPTLPIVAKVAIERIREEFSKLLVSTRPRLGLELLVETGLIGRFLPELLDEVGVDDVYQHTLRTVEATEASIELRLAALLHHIAKPRTKTEKGFPDHEIAGAAMATEILTRLKYPNQVIGLVALLVRNHVMRETEKWSDSQIRRLASRVGIANLPTLLALHAANRRAHDKKTDSEVAAFRSRIDAVLADKPPLEAKALRLDGHAIMTALKLGPSPQVGEATRYLVEQVLDDPTLNTADRLQKLLLDWARQRGLGV